MGITIWSVWRGFLITKLQAKFVLKFPVTLCKFGGYGVLPPILINAPETAHFRGIIFVDLLQQKRDGGAGRHLPMVPQTRATRNVNVQRQRSGPPRGNGAAGDPMGSKWWKRFWFFDNQIFGPVTAAPRDARKPLRGDCECRRQAENSKASNRAHSNGNEPTEIRLGSARGKW